jgi:DNA-binding response OmpR family regulator
MTVPRETATILVVDDDADSRNIAALFVERAGYRAVPAESGAACLEIVEREAIDLILLDVMMPGMDGFEVCAALHERGKRIPIILLTARDDTDTRLEGMHHGVAEFIAKPINRVELFARIRAQLHIVELARALERVEDKLRAGAAADPER